MKFPIVTILVAILFQANLFAASLTRQAYLQLGTSSSIVVRWRTDVATDSVVRYGSAPGSLSLVKSVPALVTEHEVTLTGLTANTKYYYSIGSSSQTLDGGDLEHFFVTSPAVGTSKSTRVWIIGDAGTGEPNQLAVRDAYYKFAGSRHTDLWLQLGDNAYENGEDIDYQTKNFDIYKDLFRKSVCWPTIGNHDDNIAVYTNSFSLPMTAQAGGVPSGTERYYSFDYGNIHFICLDTFSTSYSSLTAPMLVWLKNDLNSTTQKWIIAFWHHMPYSAGSHHTQTQFDTRIRQNIVALMEDGGVDLVYCGHSHVYERSYLIDGHYGMLKTFNPSIHVKGSGSGQESGSGAYQKRPGPHQGTVYTVAGSSGKIGGLQAGVGGGTLDHPTMFYSANTLGSVVLDIDGDRANARFLSCSGVVADEFTLLKTTTAVTGPVVTVTATDDRATEGGTVDTAKLTFTRTGSTTSSLVVNYQVVGAVLPATKDVDFTGLGSSITIPAGASSATITVTAVDDTVAELSPETTCIALSNSPNYQKGNPASASLRIVENDGTINAAPAAPTSLVAAVISSTRANLSWTDQSTNEEFFTLERKTGAGAYAKVDDVYTDLNYFYDAHLKPSTQYTYRVRAQNRVGGSAYSNEVTITTPAAPTGVPAAPSDLVATPQSTSSVNLAWTDNSNNETSITIERRTGTGSFSVIKTLSSGITAAQATSLETGLSSGISYTYRIRANGTSGSSPYSNEVTVLLGTAPANQAPSVNAGADQTITLPSSANLNGSVNDDGLPNPPGAVTTTWSKVSGPGTVTFGNFSAIDTTASFSAAGSYVLELKATDGVLTTMNTVSITVNADPVLANTGPSVNGWANTPTVTLGTMGDLNASVSDDGLPNPPAQVTTSWSKVSGTGTVTFGTPTALRTTVSFGALGTYVLRFQGSDGALTSSDDVTVNVVANQAPTVNGWANTPTVAVGAYGDLNATVSDDGFPKPPGVVTTSWTKVTGPGTVTFGTPSALRTNVRFSTNGTYVLRFTGNDGALSRSDDVTVTAQ
jgi:hypothetical protein